MNFKIAEAKLYMNKIVWTYIHKRSILVFLYQSFFLSFFLSIYIYICIYIYQIDRFGTDFKFEI